MSEIPIEFNFTSGLIAIAVLILVNGVLAMAETALLSARKARLQNEKNKGDDRAGIALKLTENPNQFLSVIQIGITSIDLTIGALTGATLGVWIDRQLEQFPAMENYSELIGLLIGVLPVTYLSLVLGELVPKRLALRDPEEVSSFVARPMLFFSRIFSPFVRFLSFSTESVLRLLGVKINEEPPVTEEEIQLLIDQGTEAGVFEAAEHDMVEGVFSLGDQRVYSLMTPRTDIVYLDINDSLDDIRKKISESDYSRFPVRQGTLDSILGIVKARDLLVKSLSGGDIRLKDTLKPAFFIPETMFASRALEVFKEKGTQILLVIDEFGGLQGLITINDILEEIVGQMEHEEPQATQRQDGSWLLDGMLEVDEFKEIFKVQALPHEDEYETLSGFVMVSLGRVPQAADHFEWHSLRFEVIDMDGRRVDKVLVTTLPQRSAGQEPVIVN
ncbi:MAG: HlyC/CorC family transporter [Anaerolineae bacterium]|nr:HlyC/CorC family transporter [Anaerolineae bacterium]MBL8106903.1 HlyC/CorC family transporter [Anaerolineales bacterium]MCC7189783.1 HlyC/CorC family transporter [Anaerolineales bacterium]